MLHQLYVPYGTPSGSCEPLKIKPCTPVPLMTSSRCVIHVELGGCHPEMELFNDMAPTLVSEFGFDVECWLDRGTCEGPSRLRLVLKRSATRTTTSRPKGRTLFRTPLGFISSFISMLDRLVVLVTGTEGAGGFGDWKGPACFWERRSLVPRFRRTAPLSAFGR